ncbi:MAG TPA: DNA alkylation repair protein [Candidatus Angelobacter sp.]
MPAAKRPARPIGYTKAARALRKHADPAKAAVSRGYFKDPGDQVFLGVTTPLLRKLAREFCLLPLSDVRRLMKSRVHEEQSLAYAILRRRFEKGSGTEQEEIFRFYVRNRRLVHSWDSVDDSAPNIVGPYLLERDKKLLYQLARSSRLWDRRIAMVSTLYFIRRGHISDTLKLAEILLDDEEDLIHKATGWMLREVGKQDLAALKRFLKAHCKTMPRTMLRYAIERFPEEDRRKYLQGSA